MHPSREREGEEPLRIQLRTLTSSDLQNLDSAVPSMLAEEKNETKRHVIQRN